MHRTARLAICEKLKLKQGVKVLILGEVQRNLVERDGLGLWSPPRTNPCRFTMGMEG